MDRQDIDALLIGALYGELTPADEARLAAHLESHPADRGALDDLKSARTKLRESRFFDVQVEPPQHISALLLQEAHRRAPKRVAVGTESGEQSESWFWRFARSFMAHPAMAAAAMLVVVVGVASTLYVKKGAHFADREVAAPAEQKQLGESNTVAMAPPSPDMASAGSAAAMDEGSGYRAGLAEAEDLKKAEAAPAEAKENAANRWESQQDTSRKAITKNKGIAVTTEQPQPKDFDDSERRKDRPAAVATGAAKKGAYKADKADSDGALDMGLSGGDSYEGTNAYGRGNGTSGGAAGGGAAPQGSVGAAPGAVATTPHAAGPSAAPSADRAYAQPPPPPPAAATASNDKAPAPKATVTTKAPSAPAPSKVAKSEPDAKPVAPTTTTGTTTAKTDAPAKKVATQKPAQNAPAPAPTATPQDSTLIGWAKTEHARSIALAKSGNCSAAAKVAVGVSNRAPEYYAQNMATDRALKNCQPYIAQERERAAAAKAAKSAPTATDTK